MQKLFACQALRAKTTTTISHRFFARADIVKSLDKSKISRRAFVKRELTENPEFFKAFPNTQAILNEQNEEDEEGPEHYYYKHDAQVNFKEYGKEEPFFETLQ